MTAPSADAERSKREIVEGLAAEALVDYQHKAHGFILQLTPGVCIQVLTAAGFTLCGPDECPMPKGSYCYQTAQGHSSGYQIPAYAYQESREKSHARNEPKRSKP